MFKRKRSNTSNKSPRYLITDLNPKSPISEQFRTLRTNLQYSLVDQTLQSIVITSTGPETGKSMTAANLAVVFAQQGKRTLLIDGDLRKPTVHYTMRLNNLHGLSSLLIGEDTLENAIQPTGVKDLDAITSGPIPPNPSELLSSKRMKELLAALKEHYDMIIFDTPPMYAVTDAKIITELVDGSILVIRSGHTAIEEAKGAVKALEDVQTPLLGTVLNDVEKSKDNYYYNYYG